MKILKLYRSLLDIAISDYRIVVESGEIFYFQGNEPWKLRLYLCDNSFVDVYYSEKGKYSYHWDRRLVTNEIFRHDNAPHQRWNYVSTFPKHFHYGSEDTVVQSFISDIPELALKEFLSFIKGHIVMDIK